MGRYQLLARLGAGGMGTVYLGRDAGGRLVAVKVIQAELADDHEFRARFRSEVNRARQVPPFGTAEVLDADATGSTPFDAGSPTGTAVRILTQPPDLDGIPAALREILARALANEPADRPAARNLLDWLVDKRPVPRPPAYEPARQRRSCPPAVPRSVDPGARLMITVRGYRAGLTLNGAPMGHVALADQSRTSGQVTLGLETHGDGALYGGFEVGFNNLKVQELG
jgi:hypothetical protein